MSYQWSRKNSHRASSKKKRRRRSVRSNSSFGGGLPEDENDILQMYGEDGELVEDVDGPRDQQSLADMVRDQKDIMDNVKFQPWPIAKKLRVLSLARSFVVKQEGKLSRGRGYQQKGKQLLKQVKRSLNNLENWVTPWEMRIKRIESHFGSVVTSYFIFLRWLLWINLWLTVCQCCFVIVPEMLVGPDYGTTLRKQIPDDELPTAYDLKTIWSAEGVLRYSPIFYGYYGNADIIGNGYRLPLAYLVTTLISFAYSFIVVLKKMASNSRQSRMSNKDEQFTFSWKLYTDWDYMVGNPETATTKHASIVTTMKESIVEEQEKKQEENKHLLIFLRILANVVIVILLALSTWLIQYFVERSRQLELAKLRNKDLKAGFWAENELTIMMTLITTLFPNVLDIIALMEKYHPRTALRLQLARIFILNMVNLYTLFIALYNKQQDLKEQTLLCPSVASNGNGVTDVSLTSTLPLFTPTTPTTPINGSQEGLSTSTTVNPCPNNGTKVTICWETMIGQEVFKLTIMDLIFTLGQIFIIDVFRSIFVKYCSNICCWDLQKKFPEYPDFKTAENLLHLINNQGNIWLGVFFSPGLALLNFLKLLLLMYVRCWTVIVCNVPQERIFRASRSNNFYFALLLVMLFLCMLPPLFAIVGIEPSPQCGPFSGLNRIYKVLTKTMENELPASVNSVMDYAASPGVILPIFMLMAMTIYYLVSIGRSLRDANSELRMMLEYERTEGRKKVYAMADAKHDLDQPGGPKNPGISKMASAVSSVLKATQMAKMFGALGAENKRKQPKSSEAGQKMAPAVRPKPHVPVAVVHGKRSLKRNAAAVRNRAAAVRHLQQQGRQAQGSSRETLAGTNGHMLVTPTSSLETPDVSSNDEEDVFSSSHSSSRSSHAFHQHHDDPAAIVDHTGHLRPVTEDDVHLDVDSDSEDDEELYDDGDHEEPEEARDVFVPTAPVPKRTTKPRRSAAVPPVRSKSSRPSRKIGPTEIPRITVVDFGEDEVADEDQNEEDSAETHVEPRVIVENELNNRHRHRKNRVASAQAQENERIQLRTKKTSKTHQQATAGVTRSEELHNDPVRPQRTVPAKPNTGGSCEAQTSAARESSFRTEREIHDGGVDNTEGKKTQGKTSKAKFSNILARFQKMDDKG